MIPRRAETIEAQRARWAKAIEPVYGVWRELPDPPPSSRPRHVFDLENGLRLIVSKERLVAAEKPELHVSASVREGSEVFEELDGRPLGLLLCRFSIRVAAALKDLSGKQLELDFVGVSPGKGAPHWVAKEAR